MIELDTENRLSDQLGKATDGLGSKLRGEPIRGRAVPAAPSPLVGVAQKSGGFRNTALLLLIEERLEIHPHFRGRASLVTIELVEETLVLSGRLPSHYLKQLLQEAIRGVPGVEDIDNQVDVLWPAS
jgi:hypothetical protein